MIAVVDYGMGNLRSVAKAVEYVGTEAVVTNSPRDIERADRIILPGVGAFSQGMDNLDRLGLIDVLNEQVLSKKKPFWGICLGMQLLAGKSYEFGETPGLAWIGATIVPFSFEANDLRVPHVGWNDITIKKDHPVMSRVASGDTMYFVHSYFMSDNKPEDVVATCTYGKEFTAAIRKENIFATQFHPEKSQENGLNMLTEFLNWDGTL